MPFLTAPRGRAVICGAVHPSTEAAAGGAEHQSAAGRRFLRRVRRLYIDKRYQLV